MGLLDVNIKPEQIKEVMGIIAPFVNEWLAQLADISRNGIKVSVSVNITGLYNTTQPAKLLSDAPTPKGDINA